MRKVPVLAFVLGARLLFGWGSEGHRLVVRLAEERLSRAARAHIQEVLAPGESLASLASWADEIRPSRKQTEPWHFIDIPITSSGLDMQRDCPPEGCVIAKVQEFRRKWLDPNVSPPDRREALLFLIHFVGDMHQPLHCSDNNDKGGNEVMVLYHGSTSKLHSMWDSGILSHMPLEETLFSQLSAGITPERAAAWTSTGVTEWAEESFHIAQRVVYGNLPGAAEGGPIPLDQSYELAAEPIVMEQIEKAGARLAAILNQTAR